MCHYKIYTLLFILYFQYHNKAYVTKNYFARIKPESFCIYADVLSFPLSLLNSWWKSKDIRLIDFLFPRSVFISTYVQVFNIIKPVGARVHLLNKAEVMRVHLKMLMLGLQVF